MRIGIDARYVQDHFPGIGRYTYNLVRALGELREEEIIAFYDPKVSSFQRWREGLVSSRICLKAINLPTFSLREQLALPLQAGREMIDVFHSPYYVKPYCLPCPSVVTIHDTSPSRYPQYLPSRGAWLVYQVSTWLALLTSRLVITDSLASKEDLVRFFGTPSSKIRVVYPAADEFLAEAKEGSLPNPVGEPYLLYVGINKPHKNLVRLLEAYARANVRHPLVIAGREDKRFPQARQAAVSLKLEGRVRFLGAVSEEALRALYRGADLFLFPALCEGFGLPVLEAMASGLPVIASNTSSLPEVVGDAAITLDPLDVDAWASAIRRALSDTALREELKARSLARAQLFSWQRTARACLEVYREAVGVR